MNTWNVRRHREHLMKGFKWNADTWDAFVDYIVANGGELKSGPNGQTLSYDGKHLEAFRTKLADDTEGAAA